MMRDLDSHTTWQVRCTMVLTSSLPNLPFFAVWKVCLQFLLAHFMGSPQAEISMYMKGLSNFCLEGLFDSG